MAPFYFLIIVGNGKDESLRNSEISREAILSDTLPHWSNVAADGVPHVEKKLSAQRPPPHPSLTHRRKAKCRPSSHLLYYLLGPISQPLAASSYQVRSFLKIQMPGHCSRPAKLESETRYQYLLISPESSNMQQKMRTSRANRVWLPDKGALLI